MIEKIEANNIQIAQIIRKSFGGEGTKFATSSDNALQVGVICRKTGEEIAAHRHLDVSLSHQGPRQEFLYVVKGEVTVKFFDNNSKEIGSRVLYAGDSLIQFSGGHQFLFNDDTKLIEVKQGPYTDIGEDKAFIQKQSQVEEMVL